jgi:hypothetical protein
MISHSASLKSGRKSSSTCPLTCRARGCSRWQQALHSAALMLAMGDARQVMLSKPAKRTVSTVTILCDVTSLSQVETACDTPNHSFNVCALPDWSRHLDL